MIHHTPPNIHPAEDTVEDLVGWGLPLETARDLTREIAAESIANLQFRNPNCEKAEVILAVLWGAFGTKPFREGSISPVGPLAYPAIQTVKPLIDRPVWVGGWHLVLRSNDSDGTHRIEILKGHI